MFLAGFVKEGNGMGISFGIVLISLLLETLSLTVLLTLDAGGSLLISLTSSASILLVAGMGIRSCLICFGSALPLLGQWSMMTVGAALPQQQQ